MRIILGRRNSIGLLIKCGLLPGSLCLCAALGLAQPLPSTVPLATQEHQAHHELLGFNFQFSLNGKKYGAKLSREQIASAPAWSPSSSLPLTLEKAEQIARAELRKLMGDDSKWEVTELSLRRLTEEMEPKWYYVVRLMPKDRQSNVIPDLFVLPISLSGVPGSIVSWQ